MCAGKRHHIVTDAMLRTLGLEVCADTKIGSALTRGISGGQRKRVTTGQQQSLMCPDHSLGAAGRQGVTHTVHVWPLPLGAHVRHL